MQKKSNRIWYFASKFCGQSGVLKKKRKLELAERKVELWSPGK